MKILQRQEINKQELSVFLRDLSETVNVNLKHMIEDTIINKKENDKKTKKNYHKGKKVIKKKDLIIQQQNEKKELINYQDDIQKKKKIDFHPKNIIQKIHLKILKILKQKKGNMHIR